ncbi:MAG TPA: PIN domain-containing protein [Terriglobales bacterium]|nr:PIN domain-containing protein [Terriglobales bacterium]
MIAPVFVDTNVFLYALDEADRKKQAAARWWRDELWRSRLGRTSFQVLQEFYVKVTQKWPLAKSEARSEVRDLLAWRPVVIDQAVVESAWKIQDRYRFSFWDALIVAAAKSASCRFLLTEDLQADQELDGLLVVNPFQRGPASLFRVAREG